MNIHTEYNLGDVVWALEYPSDGSAPKPAKYTVLRVKIVADTLEELSIRYTLASHRTGSYYHILETSIFSTEEDCARWGDFECQVNFQ